ncbi:MAG: hypothetical protein WCT77_11460 [Bacteroidota bacterium]
MIKLTRNLLLLLISLFLISFTGANSQGVSARAWIDTNNVLIGDQIKLNLEIKSDKKLDILFPSIPDSIGKIEFIARTKIDTVDSNGKFLLKQKFLFTSFDSGVHYIPSFEFRCFKSGKSDSIFVRTDSFPVKFNTVSVDTSKAFKDIKPPLDYPFNIWDYLVYFLIALAIAGACAGGYFLWKKYKPKPKEPEKYDPKIPPHVLALESLKQLDIEKLWQKGKVKLYYIRLTEIIRIYLERRFEILALEMVSDEIISSMEEKNIHSELIESMTKVFRTADMVKFAKGDPLPDVNTYSMHCSIDFVNRTVLSDVALKEKGEL